MAKSIAFGVRCLRKSFLRLRRELKLWIRVWWRKGGRVGGGKVLETRTARLGLFSRGYGERRNFY
jgi:hypothetical protein